jgi:hypothetical protein
VVAHPVRLALHGGTSYCGPSYSASYDWLTSAKRAFQTIKLLSLAHVDTLSPFLIAPDAPGFAFYARLVTHVLVPSLKGK